MSKDNITNYGTEHYRIQRLSWYPFEHSREDTLQEAIMRTFENRHTSYDADTMFFRKDFADNQQMQVRWQAFLHKIIKSENIMFADVVVYIQNELRPYWEKLSHE